MVRLHLNDQWQFLWHEIFCWLCLFEQKSEDHLKILWSWRVCGWNSLKKLFRDNKGLSPVNWDVQPTWDIRLRKVQSSQSCVLTQIIFWEFPTRTEATVTGGGFSKFERNRYQCKHKDILWMNYFQCTEKVDGYPLDCKFTFKRLETFVTLKLPVGNFEIMQH